MSDKTHKTKKVPQAVATKLPKGLTDEQKAFMERFETEFAASRQRIQTLKTETAAIAKKTDLILDALS